MSAAEDRVDFTAFVAGSKASLYGSAILLTRDAARAEDLLQDAYLQVWLRWRRLRTDKPEAYARKVIYSRFVSQRRLKSSGDTSLELGHPEPQGPAVDAAARIADGAALLAALQRLPPRQRAVLVLRYYDDYSEVQAAAALSCSVGTIKSQASRALARLQRDAELRLNVVEV